MLNPHNLLWNFLCKQSYSRQRLKECWHADLWHEGYYTKRIATGQLQFTYLLYTHNEGYINKTQTWCLKMGLFL